MGILIFWIFFMNKSSQVTAQNWVLEKRKDVSLFESGFLWYH